MIFNCEDSWGFSQSWKTASKTAMQRTAYEGVVERADYLSISIISDKWGLKMIKIYGRFICGLMKVELCKFHFC